MTHAVGIETKRQEFFVAFGANYSGRMSIHSTGPERDLCGLEQSALAEASGKVLLITGEKNLYCKRKMPFAIVRYSKKEKE